MEQIFFLIIVAVIGLLRFLSSVAENRRNAQAEKQAQTETEPGSAAPVPRAPAQTEEERVRKFLEALGVPTTASPPPVVQPRAEKPKAPPSRPPVLPVDPFPRPRGGTLQPTPPVAVPPPPPVIPPTLPPPFAPPAQPRPAAETPPPKREPNFVPSRRLPEAATSGALFEVQNLDAPMEEAAPRGGTKAAGGIAARLATREGLRDAMVLREIFGPPRSMQPLERQTVG